MALDFSQREELRRFLETHFNLHELKTLAFDLAIDYEVFRHETKPEFVLEMLRYFDRRNRLSCLITALMRSRNSPILTTILPLLPPCNDFEKVVIILPQNLIENYPKFREDISRNLNIPIEEVEIVATLSGSIQLLVGLPTLAADELITKGLQTLCDGTYTIDSITKFSLLRKRDQAIWRSAALNALPYRQGNVLTPTMHWKDFQYTPQNSSLVSSSERAQLDKYKRSDTSALLVKNQCIVCKNEFEVFDGVSQVPVLCPRCHANNTVWISLKKERNQSFWEKIRFQFPQTISALFIAIIFSFLSLLVPLLSGFQKFILAIFIPIAVLLLMSELLPQWKTLRENQFVLKVTSKVENIERKLWIRGSIFILLTAFVLPMVIFVLLPRFVEFIIVPLFSNRVTELESSVTSITSSTSRQFEETLELFERLNEEVTGLANQSELEPQLRDELDHAVISAIDEINSLKQESLTAFEELQANEMEHIEQTIRMTIRTSIAEISGELVVVIAWTILMGLPLMVSLFITMNSIKSYINHINTKLPKPIFFKVSDMIPVALKELRVLLQNTSAIQWMDIQRNDQGGLRLTGLYRDPPTLNERGQLNEQVRAQQYIVLTDIWSNILNVRIDDVLVPLPVGSTTINWGDYQLDEADPLE